MLNEDGNCKVAFLNRCVQGVFSLAMVAERGNLLYNLNSICGYCLDKYQKGEDQLNVTFVTKGTMRFASANDFRVER